MKKGQISFKFFMVFLAIFFLIISGAILDSLLSYLNEKKRDTVTAGIISNIHRNVKGRETLILSCVDSKGKEYSFHYVAGIGNNTKQIGDTITVFYHKSEPEQAIYNIEKERKRVAYGLQETTLSLIGLWGIYFTILLVRFILQKKATAYEFKKT